MAGPDRRHIAILVVHQGFTIALALASLLALIALGAIMPTWWLRLSVVVAVGLSVISWVLFQNMDGLLAGGATDPNAGPLLVLLSLAYGPGPRRTGVGGQVLELRRVASPRWREAPLAPWLLREGPERCPERPGFRMPWQASCWSRSATRQQG